MKWLVKLHTVFVLGIFCGFMMLKIVDGMHQIDVRAFFLQFWAAVSNGWQTMACGDFGKNTQPKGMYAVRKSSPFDRQKDCIRFAKASRMTGQKTRSGAEKLCLVGVKVAFGSGKSKNGWQMVAKSRFWGGAKGLKQDFCL